MLHEKTIISSPLFQHLTSQSCQQFLSFCQLCDFAPNDLLFMAKSKSDHLFLLITGKVKEYYINADGEELIIQIARPGECLGLSALFLKNGCHTSFAKSIDKVRVAAFPTGSVLSLAEQEPQLSRNIMTILSYRLECCRWRRCFYQKMTAAARVASYLLLQADGRLCENCVFCAGSTSQTISLRPLNLAAQEIGLARETFARVLSRLKQDGIISLDRGNVALLDMQAIKNIADSV